MGDRLLLLRVFDALCSDTCTLRPALRDLLKTMTYLANKDTGVGYSGQATIARALGIKERALRGMFTELDRAVAEGGSPVRIVRRARFRSDGRGRTSDEWVVELINRHGDAACSTPSNGTVVPDEQPSDPRLTGTGTSTNRHGNVGLTGTTMPDIYPRRDPRSDPRSRGPRKTRPRSSKNWKFVPKDWAPKDSHRELATKLRVDLEAEATKFRDHEFAKPKSDADRAFNTWLRNAAEWAKGTPRGRLGAPQMGLSDRYVEGTFEG